MVEVVSGDVLLINWLVHFDFLILVEVEPSRCLLLLLAWWVDKLHARLTALAIEQQLIGESLIQTLHLLDGQVGEVGLVLDAWSLLL